MADSRLDREPGLDELIAAMVVEGKSHEEIAAEIGAHKSTVTRSYARDPRVRAHIERMHKERTQLVTHTIDATLLGRIQNKQAREKMSVKELLEIRRELLGPPAQRLTVSRGADEGSALLEVYKRLQENPETLAELGFGNLPELPEGDGRS